VERPLAAAIKDNRREVPRLHGWDSRADRPD